MWSKRYRFGNVTIHIDSELPWAELERFSIFSIEPCGGSVDYHVSVRQGVLPVAPNRLIKQEANIKQWKQENTVCTLRLYSKEKTITAFGYSEERDEQVLQVYSFQEAYLLDTRLIFEGFNFFGLLIRHGCVLLHASYIIHKDYGILFSAPSGIGKSTQAALWENTRGAQVINGDRALVQKVGDTFFAHGICFSGTSGVCKNVSAPLKAVVVLKQAVHNKIRLLSGIEAFKYLLPQCAFYKENSSELEDLTTILAEMITEVPVYLLECLPDEDSVNVLEKVI